ncbi:hypothetical protein Nepgr_013599 [Nepenthes gracilis]|uniref:Protein kinase domain-containing protein n=1 Tax=Nepenthes gracilis TaxID=150966 RepID=A0AAD3XP54_NEPGR|nr:hypothetical protein Nepgr_013599 [Nepenthes gracilis]
MRFREMKDFHPVSERFMQDATNCINMDTTPQDFSAPEVKPVLNFSIQTGEEFSLEFMRDRVLPHKPAIPKTVGGTNYATEYTDLKGILGITRTESASVSDISMLTVVEKCPKDLERKNSSYEDKTNYGSGHSTQQNLSGYAISQGTFHRYASSATSDSSSMKIKILCSFDGKILPRPSDGKLRYVGGETHIMCICKDISWLELQQRTLSIFNQPHTIKYQLPGEDLDALVSVSSDEDLQNMMDECNMLGDVEGSKKLRIFLFTSSDMDDVHYGLNNLDEDSEFQYVVAVNGMEIGSRKNLALPDLASSSANNLDELAFPNAEMGITGVATGAVSVSSSMLTGIAASSSTIQSHQPIFSGSSNSGQMPLQPGLMRHTEEAGGCQLHHGEDFHLSSHSPSVESSIPTALPALRTNQRTLTEAQLHGDTNLNDSINLVKEVKKKDDFFVLKESNSEKGQHTKKNYLVPSKPYDSNMMDNFPAECASASFVTAAPMKDFPGLPPKSERKHQGSLQGPLPSEAVIVAQFPKAISEENTYPCDSALSTDNASFGSDAFDMNNVEPTMLPQRIYYSERTPREQAELLIRLSKSDDSLNSQFLMSHSCSNVGQNDLLIEASQNGNLLLQTGQLSTGNTLHPDSQIIDGFAVGQGIPRLSQDISDSEPKQKVFNPVDLEGSLAENKFVECSSQATRIENDLEQHLVDEMVESKLPAVAQDKNQYPPARGEIDLAETAGQISASNATGISRPEQGDILIDINDRFPRDFLLDIFSRAILAEESSRISPLQQDAAGLSMNVENHEPKHWSFFQKLAKEDFVRNDVSLIDQDHPVFSYGLAKVDEDAHESYQFAHLAAERIPSSQVDSHYTYSEYNRKELIGSIGIDSVLPHSDYSPSQVKDGEGLQFDAMMENLQSPYSEYEDGKQEIMNVGLPPLDPSLVDFDISTLQLIKNEDLEELRELGSGTFGTVYHGKWRGTDVAIKRIKKICFTGRLSEQERLTVEFWREAEILSKLHHPNVVAFYGVVQDGPGGTLATVTEYMVDGSLRHVLLRKDRHLDRRKRLIIATDAAFGMEYLHSKNIVHFDLKCDNLLVNLKDPSHPICKVGDFGLSKIKRNTLVSGGVRGTLPWMAPELLNGSSNKVSEKVDVFSFGIVLWEILTGEEPYANMHYGAIIGGIVNNTLRPSIPSYCDSDWRMLMEQCWAPNPVARPSFTEIATRLRTMAAACQTRGQTQRTSHQ